MESEDSIVDRWNVNGKFLGIIARFLLSQLLVGEIMEEVDVAEACDGTNAVYC